MSKKYFKYLFKSFWPTAVAFASIFIGFLTILPFVVNGYFVSQLKSFAGYPPFLLVTSIICIFMSGLLPIILHSRYWSKNSSDIILSMPMTRTQAFLTEGVFGLAIVVALITVGYLLGAGLSYMVYDGKATVIIASDFLVSMKILPVFLLAAIITYLSSVFAVSVSNSTFQALVMVLIINSLPYLLWVLITSPMLYPYGYRYHNNPVGVAYETFTETNWLYHNEVFYTNLLDVNFPYFTNDDYNLRQALTMDRALIALSIHLAFWLLLDFLALTEFKKLKSEHLGTVISERFGAINTLTLTFFLGFAGMGEVIINTGYFGFIQFIFFVALFIISLFFWIFIFVIRRKAKFRSDDIIRFSIAFFGGICFGFLLFFWMRGLGSNIFPEGLYEGNNYIY
ncbi:MAG: hypothetical protein K6G74_04110 [Bacilli bacterium]|nr:hypothetical protein [Bacilli bacterium]